MRPVLRLGESRRQLPTLSVVGVNACMLVQTVMILAIPMSNSKRW